MLFEGTAEFEIALLSDAAIGEALRYCTKGPAVDVFREADGNKKIAGDRMDTLCDAGSRFGEPGTEESNDNRVDVVDVVETTDILPWRKETRGPKELPLLFLLFRMRAGLSVTTLSREWSPSMPSPLSIDREPDTRDMDSVG